MVADHHRHSTHPGLLEDLERRRLLSTTIFAEDFEGAFPGAWTVGATAGVGWGNSTAKASSGSRSAFCADSGGDARTTYDHNLNTHMRRTVSLSGFSSAALSFSYWLNTEPGYDVLRVMVRDASGDWSEQFAASGLQGQLGWQVAQVNLDAFAGQSGVVVSFEFTSDDSGLAWGAAGAWVDDVVLTVDTAAAPLPDEPDPGDPTQAVRLQSLQGPERLLQGQTMTLTAQGAAHSVAKVEFYRDRNGNGIAESNEKLGEDTNPANGWSWSGPADWATGIHTYLAVASDPTGQRGEPVAMTGMMSLGVLIGTPQLKAVSYTEPGGVSVTMSLAGGPATVVLEGKNLVQTTVGKRAIISGTARAYDVALTRSAGKLTARTRGGSASLWQITGTGSLVSFCGKTIDLVGAGILLPQGYINNLTLRDVRNGADIHMGGEALKPLTLRLRNVGAGSDLTVVRDIRSMVLETWSDGALSAPSIAKLKVLGDFGADLTLTRTWGVVLGSFTVNGWLHDMVLDARAGIGTISAGGIRNASVLAGVSGGSLPAGANQFTGQATIRCVTIKGNLADEAGFSMDNFVIAAAHLGKVVGANLQFDNGGTAFGLAARTLRVFKWTGQAGTYKWPNRNPAEAEGPLALGDFQVRLL